MMRTRRFQALITVDLEEWLHLGRSAMDMTTVSTCGSSVCWGKFGTRAEVRSRPGQYQAFGSFFIDDNQEALPSSSRSRLQMVGLNY